VVLVHGPGGGLGERGEVSKKERGGENEERATVHKDILV
jgi:hypothetical protein